MRVGEHLGTVCHDVTADTEMVHVIVAGAGRHVPVGAIGPFDERRSPVGRSLFARSLLVVPGEEDAFDEYAQRRIAEWEAAQ